MSVDPVRWTDPADALEAVTAARATGALHIDGPPGGSIYLVDGEVYYVHTPAAPGVDCLLQASGTVSAEAFQTAWAAGAAAGQVGEVLIKSGALTRGEAELCTATAITDGAFALLTEVGPDTGPIRFAAGEGHWWGALRRIGAASLDVQVRKRRRLLEQTPPLDVDDQPVIPAGRLRRHHVVLTDLQWELVVHADGRRTPRELARLLGRSAFSALLETRRLIAAGLVRPAPAETLKVDADALDPPTEATPILPPEMPPERTRTGRHGVWPDPPAGAAQRHTEPEPEQVHRPEPVPVQHTERVVPGEHSPLPRRRPGVALSRSALAQAAVDHGHRSAGDRRPRRPIEPIEDGPLHTPEPDQGLLARVRTALESFR